MQGQEAQACADLQHSCTRLELGIAHDGAHHVLVDQEVLTKATRRLKAQGLQLGTKGLPSGATIITTCHAHEPAPSRNQSKATLAWVLRTLTKSGTASAPHARPIASKRALAAASVGS